MIEEKEAYPLSWPASWPRTPNEKKKNGVFKTTFDRARKELMHELELMGATDVILSTNIPLRRDGAPYASFRRTDDPGIAVYFKLKGQPRVIASDNYRSVEFNLHAAKLTIGALRGLERWGASDLLDRAFQGFTALPAPKGKRPWQEVLGCSIHDSLERIKTRRNELLRENHPDVGGTDAHAAEINDAYREAEAAKVGH